MKNNELYFKDCFTEENGTINETINRMTMKCFNSIDNAFSMDCDGNLCVNSITTRTTNNSNNNLTLNDIYPVGSIYINVSAIDPSNIFGGTWEQVKDVFLLACGEKFPIGTIGGEEKHVLSYSEMPSHSHNIGVKAGIGGWVYPAMSDGAKTHYCGTELAGENQPHNNMPPYLTVNIWKRIA